MNRAEPLGQLDTNGVRIAVGASLVKTGQGYPLACTQDHWSMEGRPIIREATLQEYVKHPDFAWAWAGHLMINLGNAFGTLYLLYFLGDVVHYPSPEDGLLVLMALYGVALAAVVPEEPLG